MQITLPHEITYDFDEHATVEEVAKSLVAQERLMREAVGILGRCFDGLEVSSVKISFISVSQGSPLKEILAAAVFLTFQEELKKEVPDLIQKLTGHDVPDQYDTLITVLVMIAAIYGASYLYNRFAKKGAPTELPKEYERLINVAGDYINVPSDAIRDAVEDQLGKGRKRSVARAARDFFVPAQRHRARSIKATGDVEIRKGAIDEIPSDIDIETFDAETDSYQLENVLVDFQAHDLGGHKRGWAAIIPAVAPIRRPVHIDMSINPDDLFTRKQVMADIIVMAEADEHGEYQPKLYYLQRLRDDDSERRAQKGRD